MILWLRLHTSNVGSAGSMPSWGTKIPHAVQRAQKKRDNSSDYLQQATLSLEDLRLYRVHRTRQDGFVEI